MDMHAERNTNGLFIGNENYYHQEALKDVGVYNGIFKGWVDLLKNDGLIVRKSDNKRYYILYRPYRIVNTY